jgi:hypothetical protein
LLSWIQIKRDKSKESQVMKTRYHSFLLRLWASESSGKNTWRASIENTETGKKTIFANLGDLLDFLEMLTASSSVSMEDSDSKASQ